MAAPAGVRAGGGESSGASSAGGVSGRVEKKASAAGHRREGTRAEAGRVMQAEYLEEADRRAAGGRGRD